LWGEPLVAVVGQVGHHVLDFDPDVVLTLLGINDLIWQDRTAIQMEQDTRTYVAEVRTVVHRHEITGQNPARWV